MKAVFQGKSLRQVFQEEEMAISPRQARIKLEGGPRVPATVTEQALRLDEVNHLIESLQDEAAALQLALSMCSNKTVAAGDKFDLLIETCGSAATVTRCEKA